MVYSADENQDFPLEKFESMLKTNEVYFFDSEDFEEIIHHYLDIGKVALAKKAIKIGLEQHPTSTEIKLLHVEILIFENKLETAEKMLDDLLLIEVSNEEILIQKANIYSKKREHLKAIFLLKKALTLTEDITEIYSMIGMEYIFMDDYVLAKEYFIKCLYENMEDYTSLYNIIHCYDYLENHDEAIDLLNAYLDKNPYCEVAWHQLGRQYFIKKMYPEALSSYDFAIYSDDTFIGAYLEKGKVLEKLKRYEEAIESYETTIQLENPTSFACLRIGRCYEKLGNLETAKKYYYKTVHEDPLLDRGWIGITDFYYRQKNYQEALYYINKAISIDGENISYWRKNAEINEKLRLYEEANLAYQRLIELGNFQLKTWLSWSDVLRELGEYRNAKRTLLQGLNFHPGKSELEYRIAGIYYLLSDTTKGEFHLKNALKNNYKKHYLIKELFPTVFKKKTVRNIITAFKKASM